MEVGGSVEREGESSLDRSLTIESGETIFKSVEELWDVEERLKESQSLGGDKSKEAELSKELLVTNYLTQVRGYEPAAVKLRRVWKQKREEKRKRWLSLSLKSDTRGELGWSAARNLGLTPQDFYEFDQGAKREPGRNRKEISSLKHSKEGRELTKLLEKDEVERKRRRERSNTKNSEFH